MIIGVWVEVCLQDSVRERRSDDPHGLIGGRAQRARPLDGPCVNGYRVVERLLDGILGDEREAEILGQRDRQSRLAGAGSAGNKDQPVQLLLAAEGAVR